MEKKNAYSIIPERAEVRVTFMRNPLQTYKCGFEILVKSFNTCSIFEKDWKDYINKNLKLIFGQRKYS